MLAKTPLGLMCNNVLCVRCAKIEDLPRILEIYNSWIDSGFCTGDIQPALVEDKLAWFEGHRGGQRPLWVLEENTLIVGWAGLCSFHERPIFARTAEVSVYIAPDNQHRGLGKYLLRSVIERCPLLGLDVLLAYVLAHNRPSNRLFESLGFAHWGLLPGVALVDGVRCDLVIFGKRF